MDGDGPNGSQTFIAGGTIVGATFVMQDTTADMQVLQATAGAVIFGITMRGSATFPDVLDSGVKALATIGQQVPVFIAPGTRTLLVVGTGGWTRGDKLKSDANGAGVTASSTNAIGAEALESANAGELGEVLLQIGVK